MLSMRRWTWRRRGGREVKLGRGVAVTSRGMSMKGSRGCGLCCGCVEVRLDDPMPDPIRVGLVDPLRIRR